MNGKGEGMPEETLEEREMSVEEYLGLFQEGSADFEMVSKRAAGLERILVRRLRDGQGRLLEDTTFFEKGGVQYTIRNVL